jgi:hypothetical protein
VAWSSVHDWKRFSNFTIKFLLFFVICKTIYEDRKGYMVDELQLRHLFHLFHHFTNIKGQG